MEFREKYGSYQHIASGKVREIYGSKTDGTIFLVATDRVSAFDKILEVEIPDKGKILTAISAEMSSIAESEWKMPVAFIWGNIIPVNEGGLYIESDIDEVFAGPNGLVLPEVEGRVTEMYRLKMFEVECIVRRHISGSAWKLYESGVREICGVPLPDGLKLGDKLPKSIFTPTTKAPQGEHDENITFGEMIEIIGSKRMADEVYCYCLDLFDRAYDFFLERGIILADTKFELGIDDAGEVRFGDEILTPDSSRYWDARTFVPGREPLSYDKQIIRDYLAKCEVRGEEITKLPDEIIQQTRQRYIELYEKITGYNWPN